MMNRTILFSILILTFSSITAQNQQEWDDMKIRLERLENMEKLRDKDLELKKTELSNLAKDEVKSAKDQITDGFGLLAKMGLPLTIGGLIALFISSWVYINKLQKDFINNLSGGKHVAFNKAISLQEFESKVKTEKNILVLSFEKAKESELQTLLFNLGFKDPKNVIFKTVDKFEMPDNASLIDLIIFNDIEKSFSNKGGELLKAYLDNCGLKRVFLAYTTGPGQIPPHPQMNLANSQFTLYQQILNTIRVGELLKESSQSYKNQ